MTPALHQLHADLSADLERIASRFKSPKLTLVIRAPDLADGDVVLSDDDLDEAIGAIERLKSRDRTA